MASALPLKLPRMMVLSKDSIGCVRYVDESQVLWDREGSVFDPLAKIVIEKPKDDNTPNVVHLRFGYSNRYWARDNGDWIVGSKDPKEDKSNPACTLFYLAPFPPTPSRQEPWFSIQHLQSRGYVNIYTSSSRIYVDPNPSNMTATQWLYTDWETLVKIPAHVAFKGDNGKYLSTVHYSDGYPYLQFSSDDPNEASSGFQVQLHPRGYLRIKSDCSKKFWRRSPDWIWIWADSDDTSGDNKDNLFWPVRLDDSTIALRNKGNDNFCKPVTKEGKTDCLNAAVETITKEARLGVLELAQNRKVYDVKYQMENYRIHSQKPYLAGKTTAINNGDKEAQIGVTVTYEDHRSHSFRRSLSITIGASASIEADVLGIVKGKVESSFSMTGGFEWGDTTTTTSKVQVTGSVTVPARSKAVVSYVGTQGTFDVPFHYSQEYTSTTDGRIHREDEVDGIFTGVNCYDFNFQFDDIQSLSRL